MHSTLLETIKIVDGEPLHLGYHQQRVQNSLKTLNLANSFSLKEHLSPPKEGIFRCRVIYRESLVSVAYFPYTYAAINSLKLIHCDTICYALKYENREQLDALFAQKEGCDDILIVKNSFLTDTSKANLAFFDGSKWFTPSTPLLYGTTRARLLHEKKIFEKPLHVSDLSHFSKVAVLNALVDFCVLKDGIIT